jgi:hypothetical protein
VLAYAVVSAVTAKAVDLFLEREQAEAFIVEVEQDEPGTAALLSIEPIELDGSQDWPFSLTRLPR